ncbi:hypothetical protein WJX82_006329 [Trebouxia sp. C0006]|nr:MAG: hypothetical protein FRX49_07245 [Trebouxia sp. A1-2]
MSDKSYVDQAKDAASAAGDKINQAARSVSDTVSGKTEEAKHEANKNTGSGESLGDKASHVGNVASNKASETKHSAQKATEK